MQQENAQNKRFNPDYNRKSDEMFVQFGSPFNYEAIKQGMAEYRNTGKMICSEETTALLREPKLEYLLNKS
jgi:hypothetical protein